MSGGPRTSPEELVGVVEPYVYASNAPPMFKDPLGLSPCPVFDVSAKPGYIQGQGLPPGKAIKGGCVRGFCGLAKPELSGIYEETDVPIGVHAQSSASSSSTTTPASRQRRRRASTLPWQEWNREDHAQNAAGSSETYLRFPSRRAILGRCPRQRNFGRNETSRGIARHEFVKVEFRLAQ